MPTPFTVDWTEQSAAPVLEAVRRYPFPPAPLDGGWEYGCDAAFLKDLCAYWADGYDVEAAAAELNRFPQFTAEVDGFPLHFVHLVGEAEGRRPLLLSHGWPGSHYEFWGAAERLAFPSRFGGAAADAFDLVIPSLPGFGFSGKPERPVGQRFTADLFNGLMTEVLGYDRYLAQGGDWGAAVTSWLGVRHPGRVRAIHLNMMALRPAGGPQTEEEKAAAKHGAQQFEKMGAYLRLQTTKPQSLAWMAAGNPVGQCAWIVERFHDWADLTRKDFLQVFSRDQLLTNVMIYVMTESFRTGAWYYRGRAEEAAKHRGEGEVFCKTPTAFANFPNEPLYQPPPRSVAERAYNVTRWTTHDRGGHFAAMEEPELFAADLQAWARELD